LVRKKRGRLRRFNGTGSIYLLPGRRSRPWVARIITGKDVAGKYLYLYTYHKTSIEAALAIPDMQRGVLETPKSTATIALIWEQFKAARYPKLTDSTIKGYDLSYARWESLHDKEITNIRTSDLQKIVNAESDMSYSHLSKMRALMVALYNHAIKDDIVSTNCASMVELPKGEPEGDRRAFSDDELSKIRSAVENGFPYADVVLFMCYTGWRPTEMCLLTKDSVDIEKGVMIGGIKTKAGKNRIVPIHQSVMPIVDDWLSRGHRTLFTADDGQPLTKDKWRHRFTQVMKAIGIDESIVPYTTRHTCASILHAAGADHLSIAKILGHKDYQITAMRYTHLDLKELVTAVDLLK
jgi:integrase